MNSTSSNFELSLWQKRQATLLYHYSSMSYLKGLLVRIDELINKLEEMIVHQAANDPNGGKWDGNGSLAQWCVDGMWALDKFKDNTIWHISQIEYENYGLNGADECGRIFSELSLSWTTPDRREEFEALFDAAYSYASEINGAVQHHWNDLDFWRNWLESKQLFPLLPKFIVHTKIEGETDKTPPRTGVYVSQDDPDGALQFAWTGGESMSNELKGCQTFNDLGQEVFRSVGREGLWGDEDKLIKFSLQPRFTGVFERLEFGVQFALSQKSFTKRPCKWYFVELIEGEYEDSDPDSGILITKASPPPEPAPAPEVRAASEPWFTALKRELAALLSSKKK